MKRLLLLVALLFLFLLILQTARAASDAPYSLDWWTVDTGGGASSGGAYSLNGTIGQTDAGSLRGEDYALSGGFWASLLEAWQKIFLPFIKK
jgi:hypothetical protein